MSSNIYRGILEHLDKSQQSSDTMPAHKHTYQHVRTFFGLCIFMKFPSLFLADSLRVYISNSLLFRLFNLDSKPSQPLARYHIEFVDFPNRVPDFIHHTIIMIQHIRAENLSSEWKSQVVWKMIAEKRMVTSVT